MPKNVEFEKDLSDQIVSMKNDGSKWDEISRAVEMPSGKCMLIYNHATVRPKDRIKNAGGDQIATLRDGESLSWGVISARTGFPESSCRSLYEEATGKSTKGNRIGKGGRHPGPVTAKAPGAKATPRAATKTSTVAKNVESVLDGLEDDAVKTAVTGFAIKVMTDSGEEVIKVKAVKRVTKTTVIVSDEEGKARTVKRAAVFMVSKKKVFKD